MRETIATLELSEGSKWRNGILLQRTRKGESKTRRKRRRKSVQRLTAIETLLLAGVDR